MKTSVAEITREYGPFRGVEAVHGVAYNGQQVWFATGDRLRSLDPATGKELRSIDVAAHAGTTFDGRHLFQIAEDRIQKVDPETGNVLTTIPAPSGGVSGLAWGGRESLGGAVSEPQDPSGRPRNRSHYSDHGLRPPRHWCDLGWR